MIGIEFTLNDGEKESYDPIDLGNDFKETETEYVLSMGTHEYRFEKSNVKNIRHYELCEGCGYEVYPEGCTNFGCRLCADSN